jgi:hypothetical protein
LPTQPTPSTRRCERGRFARWRRVLGSCCEAGAQGLGPWLLT